MCSRLSRYPSSPPRLESSPSGKRPELADPFWLSYEHVPSFVSGTTVLMKSFSSELDANLLAAGARQSAEYPSGC